MIANLDTLATLRERWIARRDELRRFHALVDGAVLCDELLAELDRLSEDARNEPLSLGQAAAESGYTADHLGRLVRQGRLLNVGRPKAPRIRRADLPRKISVLPSTLTPRNLHLPKRQIARACVTLRD